ncbi:MAG: family 16 glycoside hydrolase [Phycisphaeraceae bacterium]
MNRFASTLLFTIALAFVVHDECAADDSDDAITALVDVLGQVDDPAVHLDFLKGINEAMKGRRQVAMPKNWPAVYENLKVSPDAKVREQALGLALTFGDKSALDSLKATLKDTKASAEARRRSLDSLVLAKVADLAPLLHELVSDKLMRLEAIRALSGYDDAKTPDVLIAAYKTLALPEKQAAITTLAARVSYANRLIDAVKKDAIPRSDVPADAIRQLRLIEDKKVQDAITDLWGTVRDTPADKQKKIAELKELLSRPGKQEPDLAHGRAIYALTCAQCHTLFGAGGKVGPDITGSNRANLDYFLTNVVDPNALIGKDYQATEIRTEDDQLIVGIIDREDDQALTLKTTGGIVVTPKNEISSRKLSEKSMMPEGLIEQLKEEHLRDLVAYLAGGGQTPLLATANNAWGLFNGVDLSNWEGDAKHWSVKGGTIIAKSDGLKEYKYLVSQMVVTDFRLKLSVKLVGDVGNSGIFFRCRPQEDGTVNGLQADIGPQWWGKLLDSGPGGRGALWDKSAEAHVKKGEWNTYEIKAVGPRIQTWINGKLCVDLKDDKLDRRGHIALQLHTGEGMEVAFKDIELEVIQP